MSTPPKTLSKTPAPLAEPAAHKLRLHEQEVEQLFLGFAEALDAGLSLEQYLEGPAGAALPVGVAQRLSVSLRGGAGLGVAFRRLGVLGQAELALLKAAESTGRLPEVFRGLAQAREQRRKERARLLMGLAYPALLLGAAGCLLPLPLVVTEGLSAYLSWAIWLPSLVLVAVLYALVVVPRLGPDHALARLPGRVASGLPWLGRALERGAHGTFAEVLQQTLAAGLPVQTCLSAAIMAADHPRLLAREGEVLGTIDQGGTLAEALAAAQVFDPQVVAQVAQGEVTGKLDQVLPRIVERERGVRRRAMMVATGLLVSAVFVAVTATLALGILRGAQKYFEQIDQTIKEQTQ